VLPVFSTMMDAYRTATGRDPISGRELARWERIMAGGMLTFDILTLMTGRLLSGGARTGVRVGTEVGTNGRALARLDRGLRTMRPQADVINRAIRRARSGQTLTREEAQALHQLRRQLQQFEQQTNAATVVRTADVPADAIDATPRAARTAGAAEGGGTALARRGPAGTRGGRSGRPGARASRGRRGAVRRGARGGRRPRLVGGRRRVSRARVRYRGPLVRGDRRETLIREVFGRRRLRNLLAGFQLLDEHIPDAIRAVFGRTNIARGGNLTPAVSDARMQELLRRLQGVLPAGSRPGTFRPLTRADRMSDARRAAAIQILGEARTLARARWNVFRERLWRELYSREGVVSILRQMQQDGLILLPRGFPNTGRAPRAISGNRDGIIWARTGQGASPAEIGRELNASAEYVERRLREIRRNVERGRTPPEMREWALNLDHITPVQLNPFRFFDPENLRVLTASYNDTFLRLFQVGTPFPMTDDSLEAWIRAFRLY